MDVAVDDWKVACFVDSHIYLALSSELHETWKRPDRFRSHVFVERMNFMKDASLICQVQKPARSGNLVSFCYVNINDCNHDLVFSLRQLLYQSRPLVPLWSPPLRTGLWGEDKAFSETNPQPSSEPDLHHGHPAIILPQKYVIL